MSLHENCNDALEITTLPFGITVDTTLNSNSPTSPDTTCGSGNSYNSYWLKYVVPFDQTLLNINVSDPAFESVVTCFTGACGSLTPIAGTDCTNSGTPVQITVTPLLTIFFMITTFDPGGYSAIAFTVDHPEASGEFCAYLVCAGPPVIGSGLYYIERGKRNDTVFTGYDPVTTEDVAIPNPFAETYYVGDE